jgi:hypothetical protein
MYLCMYVHEYKCPVYMAPLSSAKSMWVAYGEVHLIFINGNRAVKR